MNIKDEAKLIAMVEGTGRYKLWDCSRNDTHLCFPDLTCFALWHYFWTHESDDQQFWQGNDAIVKGTGLSLNTVKKHRKWLLENGWLVDTGKTAADIYGAKATSGARNIPVLQANDPRPKRTARFDAGVRASDQVSKSDTLLSNSAHPKFAPNVSCCSCCSGLDLDLDSSSACRCSYSSSNRLSVSPPAGESPSLRDGKNQKPETQEPTAKPKPSCLSETTPVPVKAKRKRQAADGTPYPDLFETWSNVQRCEWLEQHRVKVPVGEQPTPVQPPPKAVNPPPVPPPPSPIEQMARRKANEKMWEELLADKMPTAEQVLPVGAGAEPKPPLSPTLSKTERMAEIMKMRAEEEERIKKARYDKDLTQGACIKCGEMRWKYQSRGCQCEKAIIKLGDYYIDPVTRHQVLHPNQVEEVDDEE